MEQFKSTHAQTKHVMKVLVYGPFSPNNHFLSVAKTNLTTLIRGRDMGLDELKTGTYFSAGSLYARSFRVIAKQGSRVCIKIVDGPANPYEGFQYITVSSIASSGGKLFVDALGDVEGEILINANPDLVVNKGRFHFTIGGLGSRSGVWEHLQDDFDPDDAIHECLSSTGEYAKTAQGHFIPGLLLEETKGELIANDPASQINVRTGPGTSFDSPHYGLVGDEVTLIESAREEGSSHIWYRVKFAGSGAEGWIRSDLILRQSLG